ncbi:MAG: RNA polymerase sigma factor [Gemmatimonadetes bacterium]|nr:RNA polymerase sigma factor [Gemmatimonadota bacterium]
MAEPAPGAASLELVRRAQRGDGEAFDRLYELSVGRVYALCLRMCEDARVAEELTQDVFVHAWQRLDTFRGESAFSTWMHRLAVNVVLQERRSAGRRGLRLELTDDPERAGALAPPAFPDERMDLERAIATLPPGARLVLVLHDVEGYKHEEIAAMTGAAVGTVKAQLHRARRLLRERLEP